MKRKQRQAVVYSVKSGCFNCDEIINLVLYRHGHNFFAFSGHVDL